jgi:hypothetical protein
MRRDIQENRGMEDHASSRPRYGRFLYIPYPLLYSVNNQELESAGTRAQRCPAQKRYPPPCPVSIPIAANPFPIHFIFLLFVTQDILIADSYNNGIRRQPVHSMRSQYPTTRHPRIRYRYAQTLLEYVQAGVLSYRLRCCILYQPTSLLTLDLHERRMPILDHLHSPPTRACSRSSYSPYVL